MRVKKYIVDTMPEAMSQIRHELGQDAVIVSTKEIRAGGFLGMFRKRCIEVVAAVDEQEKADRARSSVSSLQDAAGATSYVSSSMARSAYSGKREALTAARPAGPRHNAAKPVNRASEERPSPGSSSVGVLPHSREEEERRRDVNAFQDAVLQARLQEAATASLPADDSWHNEFNEMKLMMRKVMQRVDHDSWPDSVQEVKQNLLDQGVASELAYRIVQEAWEKCQINRIEHPEQTMLRSYVRDIVKEQLQPHEVNGLTSATRIVYMVGPTGVGKTTTIAKLAADQMFHHQRRVGLITSDTYRIAAVEQLRTYASILNVPIEVATSPGDTGRALQALEGCDLILMDTAGRNFRNDMFVNELNTMLKPLPDSETFLVLSLTSKTEDMLSILNRFSRQRVDRIIFTKADETDTYGSMLNLADRISIPFSYVTTGQNVPDDIKSFQVDEVARWIVGD
ncbi:flagellar biosynthesis protein FlhF [Paenibacillus apiarius]|uniref:Flagellar biosynthesis protein FlhF n=1 Tax=Paenibacillus apiarius TaxID=46240 RepID=A0ABT4DM26_9BACL|nr:flagellar biosynthesis protein FlhF [Paenibacillus apiarius]MCY9516157.1 flagellar biosynthesis protein FlhF [Paenibacillus apiarius]MCY9518384.1 flagellar biosynthesis protein FlhF [Paenibacillus apiarius]MCY9551215.1 flagellar biosynthesis protein FlhF [Paenibacillus apiarius]MCY9558369.1 flagellar biosynthesis protein FlhF [Paenibacillus apiarius]MCY9684769.1 flagellar biosynthesis protein FlhF [Paenibacillus apiarius]